MHGHGGGSGSVVFLNVISNGAVIALWTYDLSDPSSGLWRARAQSPYDVCVGCVPSRPNCRRRRSLETVRGICVEHGLNAAEEIRHVGCY